MSVERRLWTNSPLDLGQVIVAAAALDPELRVGLEQNAVVVSAQDGSRLLAVWPSVPAAVGPKPWVAEAFVLADTGVADAVVDNLKAIGFIAEEIPLGGGRLAQRVGGRSRDRLGRALIEDAQRDGANHCLLRRRCIFDRSLRFR